MLMTSVQCPECKRIFLLSYYSKSCVCGWSVDEDKLKGLEEAVSKRKNKRKNRSGKGNVMTNKNTTQTAATKVTNVAFGGRADSWEVEIDQVHNCDKVPKEQKVRVDLFVKRKISALMKKYPSIEWLAYLIGDKENDPYYVKDIYIPKQTVTATSVDNIQCPEFNDLGIIGVIHSHHGMGNGFSGTDHEWINQNHNISLCISKSGIAGQVRVKTPCGAIKIINAVVTVIYPKSEFDFDEWIGEETKKISQRTYTQTYNPPYNGGNGGNWYGGQGYNGRGWNQGKPGLWQNNVFYPDKDNEKETENPPTNPTREKLVPRQPLSESQKQYSTGVSAPERDNVTVTVSDDMPTIDENMSLAEALTALSGVSEEPKTKIVQSVSAEMDDKNTEDGNDSKDAWHSGLDN